MLVLLPYNMAYTAEPRSCAIDFTIGPDKYVVAAATTNLMILELRKYKGDQLVDDVVILSRYMVPEYEIKDVAFDETEEVIVRTRGGGTGISETHLAVFGVVGDKIVRFADFIIDRQYIHRDYQEKRSGTVSFPEKNKLIYQYMDSTIREGKSVSKDVIEIFTFDPGSMKYRSTKETEQQRAPDGQETAPASR